MILGWFLKEFSRSRKERGDKYQEALVGVRTVLEQFLYRKDERRGTARELYFAYLMALGRLEPYANRVGKDRFEQLQYVLHGELVDLTLPLQQAITIINELMAKSRIV